MAVVSGVGMRSPPGSVNSFMPSQSDVGPTHVPSVQSGAMDPLRSSSLTSMPGLGGVMPGPRPSFRGEGHPRPYLGVAPAIYGDRAHVPRGTDRYLGRGGSWAEDLRFPPRGDRDAW